MSASSSFSSSSVRPRALLLAAQEPHESTEQVHARCDELQRLAQTLGIEVVARELQRRRALPQTFLGPGRLQELSARTQPEEGEPEAEVVIVDAALSPRQHAALERAFRVEILDRSAIILEIFAQHASSRQAWLEVELARLRHRLPRLREGERIMSRQGGGGGRGERGHTQLTLDKERIRERIAKHERELAQHQARSDARVQRREDTFQAALVGYTNVGKTTLLEALSGQAPQGEDRLFATLGTRIRQLSPPTTPAVLLSDTVGFIRDLPHELVASFRSTLDEALAADLLLVVVDASAPDWKAQLQVTHDTLDSIGARGLPVQIVLNKVDRLTAEQREALAEELPEAVQLSALEPAGARALRQAILDCRDRGLCEQDLVVPFADGKRLAAIHARAQVLEERQGESAMILRVRALEADLERWSEPGELLSDPEAMVAEAARLGLELEPRDGGSDEGPGARLMRATDAEGRAWILRAPRHPEAMGAARTEERALRLVRAHLPVAIPVWRLHTPRLIAYEALPGQPVATWGDLASLPEAFWGSLGAFLAALQAVPLTQARAARLPESSMSALRSQRRERLQAAEAEGRISEERLARYTAWLDAEEGWPAHTALTHGELWPETLRIDAEGRLVGVEGWARAGFGDRGLDFAALYGLFGAEALQRIIAGFARAGGRTWPGMAAQIAALGDFSGVG